MAEETRAPRSWLELVAECEGKQAAILLRWAEQASVDLNTLLAVFGDDVKRSAAASAAVTSLRAVVAEIREAGDGLNHITAQRARDAELATKGGSGFAPQGMLRTRAPKT